MATEEDTEKVPSFSLVPVGTAKYFTCAGNMISLSSVSLDPNSSLVLDAEEMVYDLEAFLALREIDTTDIHEGLELTLSVVPQECEYRDDARGGSVERQFILHDGELLNELRKRLDEVGAVCMKRFCGLCIERGSWIGRGRLCER